MYIFQFAHVCQSVHVNAYSLLTWVVSKIYSISITFAPSQDQVQIFVCIYANFTHVHVCNLVMCTQSKICLHIYCMIRFSKTMPHFVRLYNIIIAYKMVWSKTKHVFWVWRCMFISARPRSAEYTIGICFETVKNTKAFEWLFTGFHHSLRNFSTTENLYSMKSWIWLATVACVVCWPISNALLNDIWLTCFTRMCN